MSEIWTNGMTQLPKIQNTTTKDKKLNIIDVQNTFD